MADDPQSAILRIATSIGEHSARIGALEEGARHVQARLDDIDSKLEHMEDLAGISSGKQDGIIERLEDLVTKFTADAPMAAYVRKLQAATEAQLARTEARHRSIKRRMNLLVPPVLAALGNTTLPANVEVFGAKAMVIRYAITAVAALYIVFALFLSSP